MPIYAPCWEVILHFVLRQPRKLIDPVFEPVFNEYRSVFYSNPNAIDLLDLSDSFLQTLHGDTDPEHQAVHFHLRSNPALEYYIRKHKLYLCMSSSEVNWKATSNPGLGLSKFLATNCMLSMLPHNTFTNPSQYWVDILLETDINLGEFYRIFENSNVRVVNWLFDKIPELRELYNSPTAEVELVDRLVDAIEAHSRNIWRSLFLNRHPYMLNIMCKIAACSYKTCVSFGVVGLFDSMSKNSDVVDAFREWSAPTNRYTLQTILQNASPHFVKFIRNAIKSGQTQEINGDIAGNTGLFVPDMLAWNKLVLDTYVKLNPSKKK